MSELVEILGIPRDRLVFIDAIPVSASAARGRSVQGLPCLAVVGGSYHVSGQPSVHLPTSPSIQNTCLGVSRHDPPPLDMLPMWVQTPLARLLARSLAQHQLVCTPIPEEGSIVSMGSGCDVR